ncbi:Peptidyl-prolyl cis-trans isomerase [Nymphaea thermarum]|nr:Peptidyl-prolyl cis-trans isomerase [Nymphaea thermarum]
MSAPALWTSLVAILPGRNGGVPHRETLLPATIINPSPSAEMEVRLNHSCAPAIAHGFKRREAIGMGTMVMMGLGVFDALGGSQLAVADEEPPCILYTAPSGLSYCDKVLGSGSPATKGQLIKAHYVGKLESGKVFDSSYNRGRPLVFRVGVGEVIKGWDAGILGGDGVPPMLVGGKRMLKIPPQLGYGSRGAGCRGGMLLSTLSRFS